MRDEKILFDKERAESKKRKKTSTMVDETHSPSPLPPFGEDDDTRYVRAPSRQIKGEAKGEMRKKKEKKKGKKPKEAERKIVEA